MLAATLGASDSAPLRLLCVGAHSDDIEIGCGGTLLRLLAERPGSTVDWVVFSAAGEREREARASAAELTRDASSLAMHLGQFRESHFPDAWAEVKSFFEAIKREVANPDVIFCHRRDDAHQDHRTLGELVWNTFRDHLILEYEIPKYEGDLGQPSLFVPLSRVQAERKVELIIRHFASQAGRTWFRPETFFASLHLRGIECNAAEGCAEGFYVRKLTL